MTTTHRREYTAKSTVVKAEPESPRKGIFWDSNASQFATRIGYSIDTATGERKRDLVRRLGRDPNAAIVKHAELLTLWQFTVDNWPQYQSTIRPGLPEAIRETADLTKPFWVSDELTATAKLATSENVVAAAQAAVNVVGIAKLGLQQFAEPERNWLDLVPAELRSRILAAVAPAAHEVGGFAVDAERLTLDQTRQRYLADLKGRIGLPEDGIKPGTYLNAVRMLRLALAVTTTTPAGETFLALDPARGMHDIAREDLIAFKRAWLMRVTSGQVAKRTASNYVKAVQALLSWAFKRERIVTRRVADLEEIFAFRDVNPIRIADYESVKAVLKTIVETASDRVRLHVYLALNCGMYSVDIGNLTLDEIEERDDGTFIVRGRDKTSHQNNFKAAHYLWPETAKMLKAQLASANPARNPRGLALLNEDGGPLYSSTLAGKVDNVRVNFWRTVDALNKAAAKLDPKAEPIDFSLKQCRKLGASALQAIAGVEVQRLYRTAAIDGADRFYVRGDFSKLTAALKRWRLVLKRDGLLF